MAKLSRPSASVERLGQAPLHSAFFRFLGERGVILLPMLLIPLGDDDGQTVPRPLSTSAAHTKGGHLNLMMMLDPAELR